MATINIGDHNVQVDDSFLSLPPDQQSAAVEEIAKSLKPQEPTLSERAVAAAPGLAKAAGTGLVKGTSELLGTPGDLERLPVSALGATVGEDPNTWYGRAVSGYRAATERLGHPTSEQILNVAKKAVPLHEPENRAERIVQAGAEFVPGAAILPEASAGKWLLNLARYGALPGMASEAAGEAVHGATSQYPTLQKFAEPAARIGAAVATPSLPGKIISPAAGQISNLAQEQAQYLKSRGIDLTAGNLTEPKSPQRFTETQLRPDQYDQQLRQFTRAAGAEIGLPESEITIGKGGNLPKRRDEIGKVWDSVLNRNDFAEDAGLYGDLLKVHDYYNRLPGVYGDDTVKAVNDAIDRVYTVLRDPANPTPGRIAGREYQELRSQLREAAMGSTDNFKSGGLHDITNAMDDAFERHLQRTGSPDAARMPELRQQYRALLTIEKARVKQGQQAAEGVITPQALQSAAKSVYGNMAYENGHTPFTDLAEAGAARLTPPPSSGTSERTNVENRVSSIGKGIGAAAGALAGAHVGGGQEGGVLGLLLGEAAGGTVSPVVRKAYEGAVFNPVSQARRSNTLVPPLDPQQAAFARALLTLESGRPAPSPVVPRSVIKQLQAQ